MLGSGQLEHLGKPEQPDAQGPLGGVAQADRRALRGGSPPVTKPPLRKMLWIRA